MPPNRFTFFGLPGARTSRGYSPAIQGRATNMLEGALTAEEREIEEHLRRVRAEHQDLFDGCKVAVAARSPGRLDVMGGIADYSGSLVLEAPLACGTVALAAICPSEDPPTLRVRTDLQSEDVQPDVSFPLEKLLAATPEHYESVREMLHAHPRQSWAAYAAGALPVLAVRKGLQAAGGVRLYIGSSVPAGAAVSSSAAIETASMHALAAALEVELTGEECAHLCQEVENHIAGAPCGIMDQMTCSLGQKDRLLRLRCNPSSVEGHLPVPKGVVFFGINSGTKHRTSGGRYRATRIATFAAVAILKAQGVELPKGYLCGLSRRDFVRLRPLIPEVIRGSDLLSEPYEYCDTATTPDPDQSYYPRSAAEHAVYENARVTRFAQILSGRVDDEALYEAGALMYASHWSYSQRAMLGSQETDLLVRLLRDHGEARGVRGARITGGGCGGTVAVMSTGSPAALRDSVLIPYHNATGLTAHVLDGTSEGAFQLGVRKFDL